MKFNLGKKGIETETILILILVLITIVVGLIIAFGKGQDILEGLKNLFVAFR